MIVYICTCMEIWFNVVNNYHTSKCSIADQPISRSTTSNGSQSLKIPSLSLRSPVTALYPIPKTHNGAHQFLKFLTTTLLGGPAFAQTIVPIPIMRTVDITSESLPSERSKWLAKCRETYSRDVVIIRSRRFDIIDFKVDKMWDWNNEIRKQISVIIIPNLYLTLKCHLTEKSLS